MVSVFCLQAQLAKTIDVTSSGTLSALLGSDKNLVTDLTLTGTINDADFQTIKEMNLLKDLDMSAVNIENGKIPSKSFENKVLNSIILPRSLKIVGPDAFINMTTSRLDFTTCTQLEELGHYAFKDIKLNTNILDFSQCASLVRFMESFGSGSFTGYGGHVILPRNLKVLPSRTFAYFKGSVDLPPSLEDIQYTAFIGSQPASPLVFPASLKKIGDDAFQDMIAIRLDFSTCIQLEELGHHVFSGIKLDTDILDFSQCISLVRFNQSFGSGSFTGYGGHIILPRNLKVLPDFTFASFKGSVELPPVLETIGFGAFSGAEPARELVLPNSLITIGNDAFTNYKSNNLVLPGSLKKIGSAAFANMTASRLDFTACTQLEELGHHAFKDIKLNTDILDFSQCTSLVRFMESFGNGSFTGYGGHVILPLNLKVLPSRTFAYFKGSLELPPSLEVIQYTAFIGSQPASPILFPASLKKIGDEAFQDVITTRLDFSTCSQLEELGHHVFTGIKLETDILDFSRCSNLVRFNESFGSSTFAEYGGHVILPLNMKVLPYRTFAYFKGSVELPPSLEIIQHTAFVHSTIKEIYLPATLQQIDNEAFWDCIQLEKITSMNPVPPRLGNVVFEKVDKQTCKLYVPEASIPLYGTALQWKDFLTYAVQPETGDGCLIIQAKDSLTNALINEGKYRIRGNSIDVTYVIKSPDNRVIIENLPNGQYTISEVYPPARYKASSTREKVIEVKNTICRTVMFKNERLPEKVDLVFKINADTTHYTGVRVGEYYWMNKNMHKPVGLNPVTADQINNSHHWYRMFQYRGDPLYTDQISMYDFNYYYGQYYSRPEYENLVINGRTEEYVNGSLVSAATGWGDPWITGGMQLIGMCGNASVNEVRQYLSYGYDYNNTRNNPPVVLQPKDYFSWFYHSYGNTVNFLDRDYETNGFNPSNTNKYGFNLLPNGSRFNGPDILHINHGGNDSEDIPVVLGDFNALNQKAAFNLSMSGLDIAEAPQMHYTKVNHLSTLRLARRISDEELGYKLYINRPDFHETYPWGSQGNCEEFIVKSVWKTKELHHEMDVMDIIRDYLQLDIIKLGLDEIPPVGYSILPNGLFRGLYVQHMIENPQGARTVKSVDDIVYIAQFNPLLWVSVSDNNIGIDLAPGLRSLQNDNTASQISTDFNHSITVYPNPVSDILNINADGIQTVEVYDIAGRLVLKTADSSVNVTELRPGMYVVKVTTASGVSTHKVSKN